MKKWYIRLDAQKQKDNELITMVKQDIYSNELNINLVNNGKPIDLTNAATVAIIANKPDGTEVIGSCRVADTKKGLVVYVVDYQAISAVGINTFTIKIVDINQVMTTTSFIVKVIEDPFAGTDGSIESTSDYPILIDLIQKAENFNEAFTEFESNSQQYIDDFATNSGQAITNFGSNSGQVITDFVTETERVEAIYPTRLTGIEQEVTSFKEDYATLNGVNDGAITPKKVSFFNKKPYKNRINPAEITSGYVSSTTGVFAVNASYIKTGYIPVKAGEVVVFSANQVNIACRHALYNVNKVFLSGVGVISLTSSGRAILNQAYTIITVIEDGYLVLSFSSSTASLQLENDVHTPYEVYKEPSYYLDNLVIENRSITATQLSSSIPNMVQTVNMYNKATRFDGYYVNNITGLLDANILHSSSDFMELREFDEYIVNVDTTNLRIAWYDENKTLISAIKTPVFPISPPNNAVYVRFSFVLTTGIVDAVQFQGGTNITNYQPWGYTIDNLITTGVGVDEVLTFLPTEINIAVGRTIEIYNRQAIWCGNINNYHIQWVCNVGKAFARKWSFTGTSESIGEYAMTLNVYNNNMELVSMATTIVKVVADTTTPTNLLAIGDSLTNSKPWLEEVRTLSDNAITFIGTRGLAPLKHEGYSGYSGDSFLSAMDNDGYQGTSYTMNVTGVTTAPTVGKEYTINSSVRFLVASTNITGGTGTIVVNRINLGSISMASGTLVAVDSVLAGDTNISYTNAISASMNPFWDGTRFNYSYYKTQTSLNPDAVQIYLGTNGMDLDATINATNIKQIVDYIRQDDTTIPIFVAFTLYRGEQDGLANQTSNDGYSSARGRWELQENRKVFNLMIKLNEILKDYSNLYFVPIALCHDSEYNFGAIETPVNPRATQTELMEIEATHPQEQGYLQMADIMFSTFCKVF